MKLYVGNIPFGMDNEDIYDLFAAFGRIESADIICDYATELSRGFAFVRMRSDEDGVNAIAGLNGFKVEGRALVVREARQPRAADQARRDHPERPGYVGSYGAIWRP